MNDFDKLVKEFFRSQSKPKIKMFMYNYVTGQISAIEPDTDEIAVQYIPQSPAFQGIYLARRGMGDSILDAMLYTLNKSLP